MKSSALIRQFNSSPVPPPAGTTATHAATRLDRIARRAHELYVARGGVGGHLPLTDWLQAEREIDSQA